MQTHYKRNMVLAGIFGLAAGCLSAQTAPHVYRLASTPETVYRGYFPRNAKPAIRVPNGAIVEIDTLSHQGLNSFKKCTPAKGDLSPGQCVASGEQDPVAFQKEQGVAAAEVLPDATEVFYKLDYSTRSKTAGGHLLTGPVYVEGAEPGDTLEVPG